MWESMYFLKKLTGFILYFLDFKNTVTLKNAFKNVGNIHELLLKLWRGSENTWI